LVFVFFVLHDADERIAHTAMSSPAVRKKTTEPTKRATERRSCAFASRTAGFGELSSRSRKEAMDMGADGRTDGGRGARACEE